MSEILCQCRELEKEDSIEEIHRGFLSEIEFSARVVPPKKSLSEPNLYYAADYDDLCGPWIFPKNPAFQKYDEPLRPKMCTWEFLSKKDMRFVKQHQQNRDEVLSLIAKKLPNNVIFGGKNKDIFLNLIWEVFCFVRDKNFTEKGVSAFLGLFYKTHRFFLSHAWRTIEETHKFFYEGLLMHAVLHPPDKDEVFSAAECKLLLDLFHTTYMQHMMLIRFICLPNYNLLLKLNVPSDEK